MTKYIFAIFISVLLFSPLAFGTVEQWSLTIMETLCIGALSGLILFIGSSHLSNTSGDAVAFSVY